MAIPSISEPASAPGPSPRALIAILSATSILGMLGTSSFAALLPEFQQLWGLDNTEAGWISALFFAGYVAGVPLLVGSTDHIDPRKIYLGSLVLGGLASFAYAFLAQGFWTAVVIRTVAGMGLAGTYMPGLKLLTDRYHGQLQGRYIAYYTAGFSFGTAFSFAFTGEAADLLGWPAAFWGAGVGSLAAFALIWFLVPSGPPARAHRDSLIPRLHFRPVFRNRAVMAFVLAYVGHTYELFALRAWLVAYLIYADRLRGGAGDISRASWISTATVLVSTFASIYGAEIAARSDRRKVIGRVMILSVLGSAAAGFSSGLPVWIVAVLCCLYSMLIMADSAALTGGAVVSSTQEQRGATLAVHSVLGFSGAVLGPLAVGLVLDATGGGTSYLAWGLAFLAMGAGSLGALFAIRGL
ncbi:MAG: MFS transporter [Alphaproteobacteria bacterium]|nr:MFS transporter [Alphaproteobacteria bacterium]